MPVRIVNEELSKNKEHEAVFGHTSHFVETPEAMVELGIALSREVVSPQVIALKGNLGAGKTTLAKGIISGITATPPDEVISPTFQIVCLYEGKSGTVAHFDLWRLQGVDDFLSLGLEEYLQHGITLIEWPDRISPLLPENTIVIESTGTELGRTITIDRKRRKPHGSIERYAVCLP